MNNLPFSGQRVVVVGTTGSGKTTMAKMLAEQLDFPHIELDALHWEPGWREAEDAVFRERVASAVSAPQWVADGNYSKVRDILWSRADTLVWLDYSLPVIFWRLWWRSWRRVLTREELWGGNQERFSSQFMSRDSLFFWALRSRPKHRRTYPALLNTPEYAHLALIRMKTPGEATRWLAMIAQEDGPPEE